jgi:hypothetical protein
VLTAPPAGGGQGPVPDDEGEDWTLAICIRCAQTFEAVLPRCPYCGDLVVTTRERASDPPTWAFKVTATGGQVAARIEGYSSATDAQAAAHEFLRRYVNQRVKSRPAGVPGPPG